MVHTRRLGNQVSVRLSVSLLRVREGMLILACHITSPTKYSEFAGSMAEICGPGSQSAGTCRRVLKQKLVEQKGLSHLNLDVRDVSRVLGAAVPCQKMRDVLPFSPPAAVGLGRGRSALEPGLPAGGMSHGPEMVFAQLDCSEKHAPYFHLMTNTLFVLPGWF